MWREEDKSPEVRHMQEDAQQQQQQEPEEQEQVADNDASSPSAAASDDDQYQQMRMSNRELPSPPSVYTVVNTWFTIVTLDMAANPRDRTGTTSLETAGICWITLHDYQLLHCHSEPQAFILFIRVLVYLSTVIASANTDVVRYSSRLVVDVKIQFLKTYPTAWQC